MRLRKEQWVIIILIGLVVLIGIDWGLPDEKRMDLLVPEGGVSREQIALMNSLRSEYSNTRAVAESIAVVSLLKEGKVVDDYKKNVVISGDTLSEKNKAFALRGYILGSSAVDEMHVPQCLGRMNPSKFDFDPKTYIYGGAYLYPIGAFIFLFKTMGLFTSTSDFSHYLENPGEIALLYLPGRLMNLTAFLATLFILAVLATRLAGHIAGTISILAYSLSTLPLNYAIVSKPHLYAAFWSLLAIFFLYLYTNENEKKNKFLIISVLSAGIAFASSFPAGIVAIIYPIILYDRYNVKKNWMEVLSAWGGMLLIFAVTNPYILVHFDKFLLNFVWHATGEECEYAVFSWKKLFGYMYELLVRGFSFPISIVGFITMIWVAVKSHGFIRRLAWTFLILFFFIGSTLGQTRISLFVGPVLCLFGGIGVARWNKKYSSLPFRIIIVVLFLPSLVFTGLYARDTIIDDNWIKQTKAWIQSDDFDEETSIGVFRIPSPIDTPPFPFINCTLINMSEYKEGSSDPDYVIIGNYDKRTIDIWNNHPIRTRYELLYNLGYRDTYSWLLGLRMESDSRISGHVYRLKVDS